MLRMKPIEGKDAGTVAEYFGRSDGGYYLDGRELRREWGGQAAPLLGLTGKPEIEQFERLLKGLHPLTGEQLTALLTDDRLAGWDFTASVPKGVTSAIERGDSRVVKALYEAVDEAMAEVERHAMTRVRKGGKDADRVTGNLLWLLVEHPETRPTKEDGMPDYDRHIHCVAPNATFDPVEKQWKALKVHDIFTLRKFFSHQFDLRMAAKLADLGYALETKLKPRRRGGMEYHTWDIQAAPGFEAEFESANAKNSRRAREVEQAEKDILAAIKERGEDAPDGLSAVARDKLGASSRRAKRKDLTLDDLRAYWDARLTDGEKAAIDATIERARQGLNPSPEPLAAKAMDYALAHHFERSSVVEWHDLAVTAMEKSMGAARPEDYAPDAWKRRGVLFQGEEASTKAVLDQESRIIAFARAEGAFRPLAAGKTHGLEGLSDEQAAAVRHVWHSTDRIMLVRGGAGTGKTTMMTPALSRLGAPVVLLAPSSDASRGQLREEGAKNPDAPAAFEEANTVAAFLGDDDMQEKAAGGIIWVDEAGLLAIDDLDKLCGLATELDARIVLQGDPAQHKSVQRHGNMLSVLEEFAGLPVAKLMKIQRQKGEYAQAVAAIRDGDVNGGDAILRKLGWVVEGKGHDALVAEYAKAIDERKPDGERKTVLVIDPTHEDGDALGEKLRQVRRDMGLIAGEERAFPQLVPLNWTEAQKGDAATYAGDEMIQFFRNSGPFKAGSRVKAAGLLPHLAEVKPEHFAVYRPGEVKLAEGDTVRITANGRDVTGKHRIDNGRIETIRGFTPDGDPVLGNGWVIGKDFAHIKHGLVSTSHASQSKTVDVVLAALNRASLGAMGAEQGYVTISRGRDRGMIFTDLPRDELLKAAVRRDGRLSATELFRQRKPEASPAAKAAREENWMRAFMEKVRRTYRQLKRKAAAVVREPFRQREMGYAR